LLLKILFSYKIIYIIIIMSSYIYLISATANNNVKKNYLMYQINTSSITSATLIDVLIYNNSINILFSGNLSVGDKTTLDGIVNLHNPANDPYPIYTDEYYVKVSQSDQQANFLSSSLISSNTITYSIANRGSDELYQANITDPLNINSLTLNSSLSVNYINGISGGNVNITDYLKYKNKGILLNQPASKVVPSGTYNPLSFKNPPLINNGLYFNGSDTIIVSDIGFYLLYGQASFRTGSSTTGYIELAIFDNTTEQCSSNNRYQLAGTLFEQNILGIDYVSSSAKYTFQVENTTGSTVIFNTSTTSPHFFGVVYLGQ
jgi:hypothetical protein